MAEFEERSPGFYLGAPYMHGICHVLLATPEPRSRDENFGKIGAFFLTPHLLAVQNWRDFLPEYLLQLKEGGHLVFWLPDCCHMNPPDGYARASLSDLTDQIPGLNGYEIVEADVVHGHAFAVFRKNSAVGGFVLKPWRKAVNHALVFRAGAHGDGLVASTILPGLKGQGYRITFLCNARVQEVLRHDPNIDEFRVLGKGVMDAADLPDFWAAWTPRFDRIFNLVNSMEGLLLKQPSSPEYFWPDDQRRRLCSESYLAATHRMAGVPGPGRVDFYPSMEESEKIRGVAEKLGDFVLWALRGSSAHKWWPHAPMAIARFIEKTGLKVVVTGSAAEQPLFDAVRAQVLEYFGSEEKLVGMLDQPSVRHAMVLAPHARLVVGPETGLMWACAFLSVPKIVLLSHSAPSNLIDGWVNTTPLLPKTGCYPCHRMHYGHDFCPQDEKTTAAACAASITVPQFLDAALKLLDKPISFSIVLKNKNQAEFKIDDAAEKDRPAQVKEAAE
jgi:ADP-heptose:LPS heptosyltransferase